MTALVVAAVASALVWPVVIVVLLARAERRILARIERLAVAVGVELGRVRVEPGIGQIESIRAEREDDEEREP